MVYARPPTEENDMSFQERIDALEAEAKGRLRRALATGNARLLAIDDALAKVAKDEWTLDGIRRQVEELRTRAATVREEAAKRAQAIPGEAVSFLATGTRVPVQTLARQLGELAKKLDAPTPRIVPDEKPEEKVASAR
jgi:hypothetical protein